MGRVLLVSDEISFRAALAAKGPRILYFTTPEIVLTGGVRATCNNGDVTLYGAPTTISGETTQFIGGSNALIYNMRFRAGPDAASPDDADSLKFYQWSGAVVKRCSLAFSLDECLGIGESSDITLMETLIHHGLYDAGHSSGPHSMGSLVSMGSTRISFWRNLLAHHMDRFPGVSAEDVLMELEFINNLAYDPGIPAGGGGNWAWFAPLSAGAWMNLIGNTSKKGPNTGSGDHRLAGWWLYTRTALGLTQQYADLCRVYHADNAGHGGADWLLQYAQGGEPQITYPSYEVEPLSLSGTITPMARLDAVAWVLANAGPTVRDAYDQLVIDDWVNDTGQIINDPSEVGG